MGWGPSPLWEDQKHGDANCLQHSMPGEAYKEKRER